MERGKIDLSVYIESKKAELPVCINKEVIKTYYKELSGINNEITHSQNPDWLSIIMRLPETLTQQSHDLDENEWKMVWETIHIAIHQLIDFRTTEGKVLEKELLNRIVNIETLHSKVDVFEPVRMESVKTRIKQNLTEILGKEGFDKNRF